MQIWQRIVARQISRHTHRRAYASLALHGGYEEAGDCGRFYFTAGDVFFHDHFESHLDRFNVGGAVILNLELPAALTFEPGIGYVVDPEPIARMAERDRIGAARLLISVVRRKSGRSMDWPDQLAAGFIENPSLILREWCVEQKLMAWTVSRGFNSVFGISPTRFRARCRARKAWHAITDTSEPLARIAAELGFADQAHMTRSVKLLTGCVPSRWRPASLFKTECPSNS